MPDAAPTQPELPADLERRLESIIELDGEARARALAELRREHPDLGPLLDRWQSAAGMFASGGAGPLAPARVPDRIGPYALGRVLGEGGMGTVVLGEQLEPIRRRVAIKLIKPGMDSGQMLARFERERQALAVMSHECIARVFDAGSTPGGQPFFVMEYVDGEPITAWCDRHRTVLRDRVELVRRVCEGVQHAHQKGVVHRDLKPGNVLVTGGGGLATPKIIDFGLARPVDAELESVVTLAGQLLGTPAYMSPEQTRGEAAVDTRTDVYALGVMLYELATGTLPLELDTLASSDDFYEFQRQIREVEPPRPSRRLRELGDAGAGIAAARGESERALSTQLERDLDWVVMTAIEKDPDRRYQSAGELGADLGRFLDGHPVLAHAPSLGYRLRKLVARNRVQAAAVAIVMLTIAIGAITVVSSWREEAFMRDRLEPFVLVGLADEAEVELWPARPALVPALEAWLARAAELSACADVQREYVAALAAAGGDDPLDRARLLEQRKLLERIDQFLAPEPTARNLAGVRERLAWAQRVEHVTIEAVRAAWERTVDEIAASDRYHGLQIRPQVGLIPLGADPRSELHEFYHPASGAAAASIPRRGPDGALGLAAGHGFVLVLLPGGTFELGGTRDDELPRHEVTLAPFFLAKHEVTQAQWKRLTYGAEPSFYSPAFPMGDDLPRIGMRNPVEQVTWNEAAEVCRRHALSLPTEAQWEYACRAGATTRFAWGDDPSPCSRFENVADAFAAEFAEGWAGFEPWRDGHVVHAAVGSFEPNAYGLHDLHGNVRELCADWLLPYTVPVRLGDGLREPDSSVEQPTTRSVRGGCWQHTTEFAECGNRMRTTPLHRSNLIGFRPSRRLDD